MPNGYTQDICDGKNVSFANFAMQCARACTPLIKFRDHPLDISTPNEIKPDSYHFEQLARAKRKLAEIQAWDETEADHLAEISYRQAVQEHKESMARVMELKRRYEAMLAKARAWRPPTQDHVGLKNYMIKLLEESIEFDCSYIDQPAPIRSTGAELKAHRMEWAQWDVEYHSKQWARNVRQARQSTEWVRALRYGLNQFVAS